MKSYAIIGMSSFGSYLSRQLTEEGVSVMAIDADEDKIEKIKAYVEKAVVAKGTDRAALDSLGLESMDGVVVCLDDLEESVLTTLHLKEMKIHRIVGKSLSEEHGKILEQIGATEVVFPEKDLAHRLAHSLTHENILDHIPLAKGYSIIEIVPPDEFLRKSLAQLNLRKNYGVQVIVVKEMLTDNVVLVPMGDYIVKDSDVLVLMGKNKDLKKIQDL